MSCDDHIFGCLEKNLHLLKDILNLGRLHLTLKLDILLNVSSIYKSFKVSNKENLEASIKALQYFY